MALPRLEGTARLESVNKMLPNKFRFMALPRLEGTASQSMGFSWKKLPRFMGLQALRGLQEKGALIATAGNTTVSWHCPGLRGLQGTE